MIKQKVLKYINDNKIFSLSPNLYKYKDNDDEINENFIYSLPIPHDSYEIKNIPANGIILNNEGIYNIANDIKWKPISDAIGITINNNNITINFNKHNLYCKNTNNFNCIGISITSTELNTFSNINITNGKIIGCSFYGIKIKYVNGIYLNNITIDILEYSNLNVRLLTPSGIYISQSTNINILKSNISNVKVKTDSSAGIQLVECINGLIKQCKITNIKNLDGAVQGFSYIGCENIITICCISNKFRSYFNGNILTSGHTVLGFCPIFCLGLIYEKCQSLNLIGSCDDVHGISIFLNANIQLNKFTVKNIIDGKSQCKTGAKSTGIEVYGINVKVFNSHVSNIFAIRPQDKQCAGYASAGYQIEYNNCFVENVKVLNKYSIPDINYGNGIGFGWAPDPRPEFKIIGADNIKYIKCTVLKCQVGFDTWMHTNSLFYKGKILCCDEYISYEPNGTRILSCNQCSECNPPIITTITNNISNNKFVDNKYNNCNCK